MNLFYGICFLLFVVVTAEEDSFECPFEFGVLPHERFCDKFWECNNYTATLRLCGNGLAFPDGDLTYTNKECDWRHLVHCGKRQLFQDPIRDGNCPSLFGLWAHEKFCNGFKRCWNGREGFQRCENLDHAVDPVKMKCVDASEVPACDQTEGQWIQDLYECPEENGLFPHDLFCDRYWECKNKIPTEHFCSNGLVFDPLHREKRSELCTMPRDVNCTTRGLTAKLIPSGRFCPGLNGFFPHEHKCNVYWECQNGKPIRRHCTQTLKVYNPRIMKCDTPDNVPECRTTSMTWETFECPIQDGYFVHERSCDKYWKCVGGKSKLHTCPNGKIFDSFDSSFRNESTIVRVNCTHSISNLSCNMSNEQTQKVDMNHSSFLSLMKRTKIPCVNLGFADCGTRYMLEPAISTPHCPRLNGIFRHERFLDRYYTCYDGLAIEMECPRNTIFNPYEKVCEIPRLRSPKKTKNSS